MQGPGTARCRPVWARPHFRHGGGAGLGGHGGPGGAAAGLGVGAGRPDEVPFPWALGPSDPPSGAQNVPAARQGVVAAGAGPAAPPAARAPLRRPSPFFPRQAVLRFAVPRPSAARAPGRPCPPGRLPAALGLVPLGAGPDGERPQRRTDLPQRELRKGGDSRSGSGVSGKVSTACPAVTQRRRLSVHQFVQQAF